MALPHKTTDPFHEPKVPISTIATRNVQILPETESLGHAARIMARDKISSILVVNEENSPSGIVTERNILHALRINQSSSVPLKDVMTSPVVSISEKTGYEEAYLIGLRKGIRHLVLVDDEERLSGIVSETDFRLQMNLAMLAGRQPVQSIMNRFILTCGPDSEIHEIVELMDDYKDSCVIVLEKERPVGIITERDIVRLCSEGSASTKLKEIMSSPVVTLPIDANINMAASRMFDEGVRHLVVVDSGGKMTGIVSERDLTQVMAMGIVNEGMETDRRFLRSLIDTIPDLVWLKDVNGIYLACNPRFEQFFGAGESEIIGKTDYDFVDTQQGDSFRENDRIALEKNSASINTEWITFANDGHSELLQTIKTPLYDAKGRVIGILGIGRDITEVHRAQEALKDREEKLLTLIETIPDAVQFKDTEGRWMVYNAKAKQLFGLEGIDCSGKNDLELAALCAPEYRDALLECARIDAVAKDVDEITHVEKEIARKDGTVVSLEVAKVPLKIEGTQKGLVAIARDITTNRQIMRKLEKSLSDFDKLVSSIPVGVFKFRSMRTGGSRFDFVSSRWCEMTGLKEEEIYRDVKLAFRLAHPEDRKSFLGAIRSATRDRSMFRWDGRALIQNEVRWFHIEAMPCELENGDLEWSGIQHDVTESKQVEQKLALADFALNQISDAVIMTDARGNLHYVNDEACINLGFSRAELLGMNLAKIDDAMEPKVLVKLKNDVRNGSNNSCESVYRMRSGESFPVEIRANSFKYRDRNYVICLIRDITERKKSEENLRLTASVFTSTQEGIVISDIESKIVEVNDAFTTITGYDRSEVIGKKTDMLGKEIQGEEFYRNLVDELKQSGHWSGEIWNRRKSGENFVQYMTISSVRNSKNDITHYVGVFADITPLKEHEIQLEKIAHYDALTGAANRILLSDRMAQSIARTNRSEKLLAVCFLDLDGFKPINDTYGHETGDLMLKEMAGRIKKLLRDGDTIARIGGDEFILLLQDLAHMEDCRSALERILTAVENPASIHDHRISITASIGVTIYPADRVDADTLLRHADQAMYEAKLLGKNRYRMFNPEYEQRLKDKQERLERLHEALVRNELLLYYQPRVDMVTGDILGLEALVRWLHPEEGLLLPADFLPAIKDSDMEMRFGEWVLDSVMRQLGTWHESGLDIVVSVNIDVNHLLEPSFALRMQSLLDRHPEISPDHLELEILESTAIKDIEHASRTLSACRKLGIRFSLDDFGTGYSSLTNFRRLQVETLKIDQSFVHGMLEDPEDLSIIESIIRLAHAFNRNVIAEGVESIEQCAALSLLGCQAGQGFCIARPMPPEDFPDWAENWSREKKWLQFGNVRLLKRPEDLVLMTAIESHRKWIDEISRYLHDPERMGKPSVDSRQCRFGIWFYGIGMARYGNRTEFLEIESLHESLHIFANHLIELCHKGRNAEAIGHIQELEEHRRRLAESMERLIESLQ